MNIKHIENKRKSTREYVREIEVSIPYIKQAECLCLGMKLSHHYVSGGRDSFCSQGNNIYGSDNFRQLRDFICQLLPNTDF